MESPVSSRLQLVVALGGLWNCCCVIQILPVLLLSRSIRVFYSDPEMQQDIRDQGYAPDVLLAAYDIGVVAISFEIVIRLVFLAVLGWAMSGHRSARWMAVIGAALVLGNDWQWGDDWWVWLVDLGLAGGLLWVLWTPEPRTLARRRRDILPRVVVVPSEMPDRF